MEVQQFEQIKKFIKEALDEQTKELKAQIESRFATIEKDLSTVKETLADNHSKMKSKVEEVEQKLTNMGLEDDSNKVVIHHCGLLHGLYETNYKKMVEYLEEKGLWNDISHVKVIRAGEYVHCTVQCRSPISTSKVKATIINDMKVLKNNNKHFKVKGEKKVYVSIDSYIPLHMKASNEALLRHAKTLKKEKKIAAYSTSLRQYGHEENKVYKVMLQVKPVGETKWRWINEEDIQKENKEKEGGKRDASHLSPADKNKADSTHKLAKCNQ